MKKSILTIGVVLAGLVVSLVGVRAQGVKEGKWSMTMLTKTEGMSSDMNDAMKEMESMPPEQKAMMEQMMGQMNLQMNATAQGMTTTITQCISNANPVPEMNKNSDEDCEETHSMDGNTVSFKVVCRESDASGQMTYHDDSMQGLIQSRQMVDGRETNTTIEIRGKYLGPCE